ncbi:MAG: AAA family ATPase [Tatlockia sp.]|nr:AAA family ATPase [Tatlockia sp.]
MPYPSIFYHKLKNTVQYVFKTQVQFHVGKFIRSQPYWKKLNLAAEEKKKSLILADWTASGWSEDRINEHTRVISKLLEDGFTLFIWQNGQVKPLTKSNLSILEQLNIRKDMTPATQEEITAISMKQLKLTKDEVQILDDYWLQAIIDQKFDQPRQLKISDLSSSEHEEEILFSFLNKLKPNLKTIQLDEFSEKSCEFLKKVKNSMPEIPIVKNYNSLKIKGTYVSQLFIGKEITLAPNEDMTLVNAITIELPQISEIERFTLENQYRSEGRLAGEVLHDLLAKTEKIKSLNLNNCHISGEVSKELNLNLLEYLNLRSATISGQSLQYILAKAHSLIKLDLSFCKMPKGNLLAGLNLKFLEILELDSTALSEESMIQLLTNTPNLKFLQLAEQKISDNMITRDLDFESLEYLNLNGVTISAQSFQHLLHNAKKLKKLDLQHCTIVGELTETLDLISLETLDLSLSTISSQSLKRILDKALNLKSLKGALTHIPKELNLKSLESLNLYTGASQPELKQLVTQAPSLNKLTISLDRFKVPDDKSNDLNLSSLEVLNLHGLKVSTQILQYWLSNTGNIKHLSLGFKEIVGEDLADLNLKSLETLILHWNTTISAESLQSLLLQTVRLKSLRLPRNIILGDFNKNLNLTDLEILSLSETNITRTSLECLLIKASKLKLLNLEGCLLDSNFTTPLNLKSLETLNLHSAIITVENLQRILANAEQLKSLDLQNCEILGEIADKVNLKSLESLKLPSNTSIRASNFQLLLANAESLKSLDLRSLMISGDMTEDLNLKSLETLNLRNTTITAKSLQHLLANAQNLKSIDLRECTIVGDLNLTENLNLKSLESLKLKNKMTLSAQSFEHFLAKAKNLKSLDLGKCTIVGDIASNLNLKFLETLKFHKKAALSDLSLYRILYKAKSLKYLDLSSRTLLTPITDKVNLESLQDLSLQDTTISANNLHYLLANAKNLKSINFQRCKISGADPTELLKLKSLKVLNLWDVTLTRIVLQQLLAEGENLKCLYLHSCILFGPFTNELKLTSLEILNLSSATILAEDVTHLLSKSDNLKDLDLGSTKITTKMTNHLNLKSLEKLTLSTGSVLVNNLQPLLAKTVLLKELHFYSYKIVGDMSENPSLKMLETLTITKNGSTITAQSLQGLLSHTEKLKKISLERCTVSGDFTTNLNLSALETLDLSEATINTNHLILLLLSAPRLKGRNVILYGCRNVDFANATLRKILNEKGIKIPESPSSFTSTLNTDRQYPSDNEGEIRPKTRQFSRTANLDPEKNSPFSGDFLSDLLSKGSLPFNESIIQNLLAQQRINNSNRVGESDSNNDQSQNLTHSETLTKKNHLQNSLAPQQRRADSSLQIDADTANDKQEFQLNQIFCGRDENPHPSEYRLSVYHRLTLSDALVSIDKAFNVDNRLDDNELEYVLEESNIPKSELDLLDKFINEKSSRENLYYGKLDLILDNRWQALPSLSSAEKILEYHLDKSNVSCEIKYSLKDNLYYIRSKDKGRYTVTLDFLLEKFRLEKIDLPETLYNLIQHYSQFGEGAHSFKGPGNGQQYLDAINKEKTGACRHRSFALMDAIQNHKQDWGLPDTIACRFNTNDCHAFVEIQLSADRPWIAYNLGGYAADLTLDKSNMPNQLSNNSTKIVAEFATPILLDEKSKVEEESKAQPIKAPANVIPLLKLTDDYDHLFETWQKEKTRFDSTDAFCQRLASGIKQKQLIELSSSAHVQAMSLTLESYCHRIHRPVFYVHSPDDLVCSAPYIEKTGLRGELKNGPGGVLYDFLTTNQDKANPPLLIINYDRFDADDIVRLNSLLDSKPKADGTSLPACAVVVGLINPAKPDCYQGEDFYSRFGLGNIEICPFAIDQLKTNKGMEEKTDFEEKVYPINLCHAPDWEERLLGRWIIKKDHLYFEEGMLAEALKSGLPIEIQNGLWTDDSFCHLWDRAHALGYFESGRLDISKSRFIKSEGYDWENLKKNVLFDSNLKAGAEILNPTRFGEFFHRYQCDNSLKQLDTINGVIAENHDITLDVNLSRTLSEDEWGALLIECQKHQVILNCHCASSVSLPKMFDKLPQVSQVPTDSPIVIQSTDVDVTVRQLTSNELWTVLDVSELSYNDLWTNINGKMIKDAEKPFFEFTQSDRVLKQALDNQENVILKGNFSQELADGLASLILERQQGREKGILKIITDDAKSFNYAAITHHKVSVKEKFDLLKKRFPVTKINELETLETELFCKSVARLISPHSHPWQGMYGLSGGIQLQEFDEENSKAKSDAFIKQRQDSVNEVLKDSPYVFLTGLTGVGKSTFVEKYIASETTQLYLGETKDYNHIYLSTEEPQLPLPSDVLYLQKINVNDIKAWTIENGTTVVNFLHDEEKEKLKKIEEFLFPGENEKPIEISRQLQEPLFEKILSASGKNKSKMQAWAEDQSDKLKILFIDEANLTPRQWSEFEGLFDDAPSILLDKKFPLTENHKVIFAGNPLNYGDERNMAALFERHGNALIFHAMPQEFIFEVILKPVFANTKIENQSLTIAREILKIYRFLCECSTDEVLISPRELQMMALLVISHMDKNPQDDVLMVARHHAYLLAKNLVPKDNLSEFNRQFSDPIPHAAIEKQPIDFVLTPTREPLYQYLNDLLALREYRNRNQNIENDNERNAKLYGGLGGIVIEGEPGIGKSELVIAQLLANEYQEVTLATNDMPINSFYRMPVSMEKEEKERLLLKAFHSGSVVVVDEINSAPMMESLLNNLLMGKTPNGERPKNPGFMVIGTQNPVTMAGRRKPSNALMRRMMPVELPLYPAKELKTILIKRGIERKRGKAMINAYQRKRAQAKREQLSPAPTVRTLINVADDRIKAIGKITEIKKSEKRHKKEPVNNSVIPSRKSTTLSPKESISHSKASSNPVSVGGADKLRNKEQLTITNKNILSADISNASLLTVSMFKNALNGYISDRRKQEVRDKSTYHTFFGWVSGMSSTLKISAAENIIDALNNPKKLIEFDHDELVALKNGNLGVVMKKFESLLPEQYKESVKNDSYNLSRRTW